MEILKTKRNFNYTNFKDEYGNECSLQKSSSAMSDNIWLGIKNPKLVVFKDSNRGEYIETEMPDNFMVNARMHLSIEQVKELLPYLNKFVETGDIE